MTESIEYLLLNSIKKHGSVMPLFKAGYAYSKIMEWVRELERQDEIIFCDDGIRRLTDLGKERLKNIKKPDASYDILPLENYKIQKWNIDDIYLP